MKISVFFDHVIESAKQSGLSIEEILTRLKKSGIDAVECSYASLKGSEDKMKDLFDNAGLGIASIFRMFDAGYADEASAALDFAELAAYMGAKKTLVVPGLLKEEDIPELASIRSTALGSKKSTEAPVINQMVDFANYYCSLASQKGITAILEDFDNAKSPIAQAFGMMYFFNNAPLLRCAFDTGNFLFSGEDELEAFELLKDKIAHVHMKDRSLTPVDGEKPLISVNGTPLYSSPVGYGCIKMEEIVCRLHSKGYDGYLSIEHYGSLTQLEYMEKSAEWLTRHI